MAINVYYIQQGNKLTLSTANTRDFNSLNNFLLWAEKLGTKPDEDIVPFSITKILPLQNQLIIASDFLFTKMPRLSWASGGSVIGMLHDNGFALLSASQPQIKSLPERFASFFNIYPIKSSQTQQIANRQEKIALLQQIEPQTRNTSVQIADDLGKTILQYNKKTKTFLFFSEKDYSWSKAVIRNIRAKLSLNEKKMKPFDLICEDGSLSVILKSIHTQEEKMILDLLILNGFALQIIENKNNKNFYCLG